MTGAGSGGGGGYDYVESFFPGDAEEGESLYHFTENAAFVYTGAEWVEQTVTAHSQLSGVGPDTHHPQDHGNEDHTETYETEGGAQDRVDNHRANETHDQPQPAENHGNEDHTETYETEGGAQDRVNNHEADPDAHHEMFEPSDYNPEADTHNPPTQTGSAGRIESPLIYLFEMFDNDKKTVNEWVGKVEIENRFADQMDIKVFPSLDVYPVSANSTRTVELSEFVTAFKVDSESGSAGAIDFEITKLLQISHNHPI